MAAEATPMNAHRKNRIIIFDGVTEASRRVNVTAPEDLTIVFYSWCLGIKLVWNELYRDTRMFFRSSRVTYQIADRCYLSVYVAAMSASNLCFPHADAIILHPYRVIKHLLILSAIYLTFDSKHKTNIQVMIYI